MDAAFVEEIYPEILIKPIFDENTQVLLIRVDTHCSNKLNIVNTLAAALVQKAHAFGIAPKEVANLIAELSAKVKRLD